MQNGSNDQRLETGSQGTAGMLADAKQSTLAQRARTPRLWPAVVILALQVASTVISVTPTIDNLTRFLFMMIGPAACLFLFVVWLLLASQLAWVERFAHLGVAVLLVGGVSLVVHANMGVAVWIYSVPLAMGVVALALWLGRSQSTQTRVTWVAVLLSLVLLPFTVTRLEGFTGAYLPEFTWRWAPTGEPTVADAAGTKDQGTWQADAIEWPAFRGPRADSVVLDLTSPLSWQDSKPAERWRISLGAGWSSFAYVSGRLFTQEQRQEQELVTCYDAASGALLWQFAHTNRFEDVVAGAGPRSTPTYAHGRLFTYGAKAVLTCLNAASGEMIWQRDLMKEVNAELPVWGFSNSPLVLGNLVIVYAGGDGDHGLVAYDAATGAPAWQVASHGMNFSTAHRVVLSGLELVLFGDESGLMALEPATGRKVWSYKPVDWKGPAICQPYQINDTSLIVPLGDGVGMVRLEVRFESGQWRISERWSSKKFRPSFNDFVYHKGFCYGFDQHLFCCLNAETGERMWKEGRYGFGQVILLDRVGQMIVTTEGGEAVLLAADPERHRELGRVSLVDGKTWNHPVIVGNKLFHRNGKEAVCVELLKSQEP